MFDEGNLVSYAGLLPPLELAEQTRFSSLLDEHVRFTCDRSSSGAANATPKLTSIIAGMAAGADSINDLDIIRAALREERRGAEGRFAGTQPDSTAAVAEISARATQIWP